MKPLNLNRLSLFMLLAAALSGGCRKDDADGLYARLAMSSDEIYFTAAAGKQDVEMYSNLKSWQLKVVYHTSNESWVDVFDNRGAEDGRFTISVSENTTEPFVRRADVCVVSGGAIYGTIHIRQEAAVPYLELDMNGMSTVSASSRECTATVKLRTNVVWKAETLGATWLTVGESTATTQTFNVSASPLTDYRSAQVRFTMVGTGNENISVMATIRQRGSATDPLLAQTVTLAEALSRLPGGVGSFTDNICAEVYVTSDRKSGNFDANKMWVQDASGKALLIQFNTPEENIYDLNSKIRLHLVDLTVLVDPVTGQKRVSGASVENMLSVEASASGVAPVAVSSLANLSDYENTLVTVSGVQYEIPMGTYVNIDESNLSSPMNPNSAALGETLSQYSHILRDGAGNSIRLLTSAYFKERFAKLIAHGSGSITGVVMKHKMLNNRLFDVMRIRSAADDAISTDETTRLTRDVVRFGPWANNSDANEVRAAAGTGTIKYSMRSNITNASTGTPSLYFAWTYARLATATVDDNNEAHPAMEGSLTMQYACINANVWLNGTGSSILDAQREPGAVRGEAWIITTSSAGVTGDMTLVFSTSSSQTGPRFFCAEWATGEGALIADWRRFYEYESVDWNSNYHAVQFSCPMPDAAKGQATLVVRLRVIGDAEARNNSGSSGPNKIASGGTNRIGYLAITEKK